MKQIIQTTIVELLESWAMMLVDCGDKETQVFELDQPLYIATLTFSGVVKGKYEILCKKSFGQLLVQNLLGEDSDVDDSQVFDALKEMTNVMSGNLLTTCFGNDAVFDLNRPEVRVASKEDMELFMTRHTFYFIADDHPIAVTFDIGEGK